MDNVSTVHTHSVFEIWQPYGAKYFRLKAVVRAWWGQGTHMSSTAGDFTRRTLDGSGERGLEVIVSIFDLTNSVCRNGEPYAAQNGRLYAVTEIWGSIYWLIHCCRIALLPSLNALWLLYDLARYVTLALLGNEYSVYSHPQLLEIGARAAVLGLAKENIRDVRQPFRSKEKTGSVLRLWVTPNMCYPTHKAINRLARLLLLYSTSTGWFGRLRS